MSSKASTPSTESRGTLACPDVAAGGRCAPKCPPTTGIQRQALEIAMVGVNHRTATVAVREKLAFGGDVATAFLKNALGLSGIAEILLLSTCNRTEIYLASCAPDIALDAAVAELLKAKGITEVQPDMLYRRKGREAVASLFRVACGADSMVLGETEITGQVKDAYRLAEKGSTAGPLLNRLSHMAFRCAKRVRTETGIGAGMVSVASVAVDLAAKVFSDLEQESVLIVGAGETGALVGRHFRGRNVKRIAITNRTLARSEQLATELGAAVVPFAELESALAAANVVVCTTSSPEPILTKAMLSRVLQAHGHGDILLIDMGVPRDVDPTAADLDGIFLYNIDALSRLTQRNLTVRQEAIPEAEEIIQETVDDFESWYRMYCVSPMISTFLERLGVCRQAEMEAQPGNLTPGERHLIERATQGLVKRIARIPIQRLKENAEGGQSEPELASALFTLFDLESQTAIHDDEGNDSEAEIPTDAEES